MGLGSSVDQLPNPLQMVLGLTILLPLMLLYGFSFMIGSGLLVFFVWITMRRKLSVYSLDLTPLALPALGAAWLAAQALPFLMVPRGTPIRPIGWAFYVLLSALALTILSVGMTISHFKKKRNKTVCALGILFSIALMVIPSFSLGTVARIKGLILEP